MLLQIPTAILLIILALAIIVVVTFLIFIGVINFRQGDTGNGNSNEEGSIGDQVKERQERLDEDKENE